MELGGNKMYEAEDILSGAIVPDKRVSTIAVSNPATYYCIQVLNSPQA